MEIIRVLPLIVVLAAGLLQTGPGLTAPVEGAVLQGTVEITGSLGTTGFTSAELAFGYSGDPTDTWFLLQNYPQPAEPGIQFTWNTTTLTDGDYRLRLRAVTADGSTEDYIVGNLHIRNRTAMPSATPAETGATQATETSLPAEPAISEAEISPVTETLAAPTEVRSTPTPALTNPVEMTTEGVYSSLGRGALLALALFAILGLWLRLRRP